MWTLIKTDTDWTTYQYHVSQRGETNPANLQWGPPPQAYPCLATSVIVDRVALDGGISKAVCTALVYPETAARLFEEFPERLPMPVQRHPQDDFNRDLSALTLALMHFMMQNKLCTAEQVDKTKVFFGSRIDQWWAEDAEQRGVPAATTANRWSGGE